MKLRTILLLGGAMVLSLSLALGCTDIKQLMDPEPAFSTLVVAYGDSGPDATPCDDTLPMLDGVGTDQEWALAQPLFVRMSGANGTGGDDYFLEVRAVWSKESKGGGGADRIYFLIRYPDPELNAAPDRLAYIQALEPDEFCRNSIEIDGKLYCPSPVQGPKRGSVYDSVTVQPGSWTRINRDGREDQVVVTITEVQEDQVESGLIDLNRSLLGVIGPQTPSGFSAPAGVADADVWVWRAGRTNLQPVNQFASWDFPFTYPDDDRVVYKFLPAAIYSRFTNTCGFAEDLWINDNGSLVSDNGPKPFESNFKLRDPVPTKWPQCPPQAKEISDADLTYRNGSVSSELALWWPSSTPFQPRDSLACTRTTARPPKLSVSLLPGEYDYVAGWGIKIPYDDPADNLNTGASAKDVRAMGTHAETQEKGFGVRTLEIMRKLDTGEGDDLVIQAPPPEGQEYRMVIGVFNDSGRIASGSTEIRLRFEPPKPKLVGDFGRC